MQGKRLTSIVHRAAFLQELLAGIPPDQMHASKKLERVDLKKLGKVENEKADQNSPVTLHFTDGTAHECDILVGADGSIAPSENSSWERAMSRQRLETTAVGSL